MKKLYILFIITLFVLPLKSHKINKVLKDMPSHILPGLTEEDRDMMLLENENFSIPIPLGEITKVEHNDSFIKLRTSKAGTTQIKILINDDYEDIICVIKTVCGGPCDSNIKFYSVSWEELSNETFIQDVSPSYFFDENKIDQSLISDSLFPLFYPISAEFVNGTDDIMLRMDFDKLFSSVQPYKIKPFIVNEEIYLKWNGSSFIHK